MKEKIFEILKENFEDTVRAGMFDDEFNDVAEQIMQLKIECPDTEEIKRESELYAPTNLWERITFQAGADYIKNEIARRNQ